METCVHCGRKSNDVRMQTAYVGGSGNVSVGPFCRNQLSCWLRWDEQHPIRVKATRCQHCGGDLEAGDEKDELKCLMCSRPHNLKGKLLEHPVGAKLPYGRGRTKH